MAKRYFDLLERWKVVSKGGSFWPSGGKGDAPEANLRHSVARQFEDFEFAPAFEVGSLVPTKEKRHHGRRGRLDLVLFRPGQLVLGEFKLLYNGGTREESLLFDAQRLQRCAETENEALRGEFGLPTRSFKRVTCLLVGCVWTAAEAPRKLKPMDRAREAMLKAWRRFAARRRISGPKNSTSDLLKFLRGQKAQVSVFTEDVYPEEEYGLAHLVVAWWHIAASATR
jgi:hypothetical protein